MREPLVRGGEGAAPGGFLVGCGAGSCAAGPADHGGGAGFGGAGPEGGLAQ